MRVHNKIGSKERFMEMFENVNKVKVNEKKLIIKENKSVTNEWGKTTKPSRITESTDMDRYENVTFAQGDDANEPLEILNTQGEDAALEYLKQWHDFGNHEGTDQLGAGTSDQTFEKDGYIMSYNPSLGYIGLQYDLQQGQDTIPESFDSPEEKDHEYLNKGNITDVLKQTKPDDGTRYPAVDALKVSDPSLEKMKGDDAPITPEKGDYFKEDDQDVADDDSEESDDEFQTVEPETDDGEIGGEIEAELGDEESPADVGVEVEPETDDAAIAGIPDVGENPADELEGGLGDDASATDFDADQISKGIKVEMEHSDDPKMALEIVLDHLSEDPQYYGEGGLDPDVTAMDNAQQDVHNASYGEGGEGQDIPMSIVNAMGMGGEQTPIDLNPMMGGEPEGEQGDEESEILFGKMGTVGKDGTDEQPEEFSFDFKPKNVGEEFDFAGQERDYYDNKYEGDDEARKEELLAKGEMASPEEKEELAQLLGLESGGTQMGNDIASQNGFGNITPSGSV